MHDKTLSRIAVICSILGLILLFMISFFIKPPVRTIPSLTQEDDSRDIVIFGYIQKAESGKVTKLRISQLHSIDAILFDNISIEKGTYVKAVGEYRQLRGNKELIIDKLDIKSAGPDHIIPNQDFS